MKKYGKLVRDKIPDIIRQNGEVPVIRTLNQAEYLLELIKKLKEEVTEFEEDHSVEELADIQEVTMAICEALGVSLQELAVIQQKKATKNGRFKNRVYLESVKDKKT